MRQRSRHWCAGQLGKQTNCEVLVSLSLANRDASLRVTYQLNLPKDWGEGMRSDPRSFVPRGVNGLLDRSLKTNSTIAYPKN
jgi:hypothetical protein